MAIRRTGDEFMQRRPCFIHWFGEENSAAMNEVIDMCETVEGGGDLVVHQIIQFGDSIKVSIALPDHPMPYEQNPTPWIDITHGQVGQNGVYVPGPVTATKIADLARAILLAIRDEGQPNTEWYHRVRDAAFEVSKKYEGQP